MQAIIDLVRNLAIILMIASFLEMILPNKSMRGYVQLVMGLFVISALLNPITQFLRLPLEMEIPAWSMTSNEDLPVLADGQKDINNPIQEQYRLILSNQIKALALGVQGVEDAKVEIALENTNSKIMEQPQISKVDIYISESEIRIQPVEPVEISKALEEENSSFLEEKVRERIVSLMQISSDKINIRVER